MIDQDAMGHRIGQMESRLHDDNYYNWIIGIPAFFGLFLLNILSLKIPEIKPYLAPFCHQLDHRTFSIDGHYFGMCARCTGVYLTFGVMALSMGVIKKNLILATALEILSYIISSISLVIWFHDIELGNWTRFFLGISYGVSVSFLVWRLRLGVLYYAKHQMNVVVGDYGPPIPPFWRWF